MMVFWKISSFSSSKNYFLKVVPDLFTTVLRFWINMIVLHHFVVPKMDQAIFQLEFASPQFVNPVNELLNNKS